ncbi:uncharacterized protein [Primulina eburnea]|uniref:uncharacterized protein n=1 Tax=Primulina eburnea TaxID=1245227 RepID=UPI003C6BEFC8
MENIRRNYDKFSFPGQRNISDQFEFGCVTTPGSLNSPADHLFFNGRLLPHVFPIQTSSNHNYSYSRSTSRTSSTGSYKDSLMSSRSNSTNSRSSNCSSARTSTSTDHYSNPGLRKVSNMAKKERYHHVRPPVLNTHECQYGSSQKWQFIAGAPVLKHQGSRSRKADHVLERKGSRKSKRVDEDHGGVKPWFGKRVLKSFVSACKECHAIKTSQIQEVLPRNLEV